MAYTIISQNNTTTTLSDENGNVITVPARVTLATSTDYTIIKVNNNSVDLESGDGKIIRGVPACVVLAGGGGGDQHNLGYYATQAALEEAYPTAEAGDWAIVGATDTVWIWDEDTSAWVDSDQKGQVTSVNGQTGEVSLSIPDAVQYSTMPTASADNLGDIVQFTGTTDATYTNGYFYKCVSDGQEPATYSWSQVSVQPTPSGLPDQTGQSGKFLTTDGTSASWGTKITGSYVAKGTVATINSILRTERNNSTTTTFEMAQYLLGGAVDGQIEFDIRNGNGARVGRIQFADAIWIDAGTNIPTLGKSDHKWYNVYTEKLNNGADIAIPTTGGTMAVIGVNTTATLAVADWSSSTQTVTVSGVKADSVVFVSPDPASASDYASAGILCTAQAADSLTFTCTTTPTNAITVNVVCM